MKRYVHILAAMIVLLAACSGGSAVAATVNGAEITDKDVEALVYELGEDFGDSDFVEILDIMVQWRVIGDAAQADFGIAPTAEEIGSRVEEVHAAQGPGSSFDEFLAAQNISASGMDLYAEQLIIGDALIEELRAVVVEPTVEEAQQLLADDREAWTEVCAAHILVATEEEANAALDRLEAGEEFAAVATETSLDTTSGAAGGDLGCSSPETYVPEFAAATMTAEPGTVVGPVQTQFGFHLIRVDSRTEATIGEIRAGEFDVRLAGVVDDWFFDAMAAADISIAEEWGTWETEPAPRIAPPPG